MTDFGLIGLAVMGQNLALNIADHGFKTSVFNRTFSKTKKFLDKNSYSENLFGFENLQDFVSSIQRPRRIVIMVQAGKATDSVIDSLIPLLDEQDIIIDGGNAKWTDTIRREAELKNQKLGPQIRILRGISSSEPAPKVWNPKSRSLTRDFYIFQSIFVSYIFRSD